MEEKTDLDLVMRARAGDKEAFGELVRRYQSLANRIARGLVSQDVCAQELVQDAMLEAYLSLAQLRDASRFKGWLCGIVLNLCRSYLRNQKTVYFSLESLAGGLQIENADLAATEASPEQLAEERELHQIVLEVVNSLSTRDREITLSFYYDQLSAQEIAVLLKISVGAVKVRLHRARQHLKEKMLAQYSDLIHDETRRNKMVKVKIADVLKRELKDEQGRLLIQYVVALVDEAGRRALPIWVGPFEGQTIAMEIGKFATPRPLTFYFFSSLLKAIDAKIEEVRVESLKNDTFYAVVKIRCGIVIREVDARPSDAMALALVCDCPILVAEDVLATAANHIPESASVVATQSGIKSILEEIRNQPTWRSQDFLSRLFVPK